MEFVKFSVNPHLFERFSNSILYSSQQEIKDLPGDIYRRFICPTAWSLCVVWKFKFFHVPCVDARALPCLAMRHDWLNLALRCFTLSHLIVFSTVVFYPLLRDYFSGCLTYKTEDSCSTHCSRLFFIQCHHTIQYNITLLPSVSTIAQGMFCGAKYTHHTFTPGIKH